jgi:hypothetical protein
MTDQSALPLPPNGTAEELGVYNIIKEFYLDSSRTEYRFDATLSGALRKVVSVIKPQLRCNFLIKTCLKHVNIYICLVGRRTKLLKRSSSRT